MPISQDEAASALKEIERTGNQVRTLQAYAGAAPHFFVWGLVWMFGYALSERMPESRNIIWACAITLGALSSIVFGRSSASSGAAQEHAPWRYAAISFGIAMFFGLSAMILKLDDHEIAAFIPLMFGGMYMLAGLFAGIRFAVCGAVLAIATTVGYLNAGEYFGYWMAAFGGGILLLTGFWLRRA